MSDSKLTQATPPHTLPVAPEEQQDQSSQGAEARLLPRIPSVLRVVVWTSGWDYATNGDRACPPRPSTSRRSIFGRHGRPPRSTRVAPFHPARAHATSPRYSSTSFTHFCFDADLCATVRPREVADRSEPTVAAGSDYGSSITGTTGERNGSNRSWSAPRASTRTRKPPGPGGSAMSAARS